MKEQKLERIGLKQDMQLKAVTNGLDERQRE